MRTIRAILTSIRRKTCKRCGYNGDEEAFFRSQSRFTVAGILATRPVCIGCELTDRNNPSPEARSLRKAHDAISNHAAKWGITPAAFSMRFGWEPDRMVHDLLHVAENTCVYCWSAYGDMGHGLDDITIDIIDPNKDPYYHTNAQWCCRTCNAQKSTLSPELWSRRLIEWRRWRAWMAGIKLNQLHGLPLFDPQLHFPLDS
jgi:hypothetical protein